MLLHFRRSHLSLFIHRFTPVSFNNSSLCVRRPISRTTFNGRLHSKDAHLLRLRWRFSRHLLFIVPLGSLVIAFGIPRQKSVITPLISSPTIIPCSQKSTTELFIQSPYEYEPPLWKRITKLFKRYILVPLLTARRFVYLCILFVPVLLSSPMLLVGAIGSGEPKRRQSVNTRDKSKRRMSRFNDLEGERWGAVWWYDFLVRQMQRAGPTFIKLAQWAAIRVDLFPEILCDKMGMLHSNGRPHSLHHTIHTIEAVFRRPFSEVFEDFDTVPIGVGAIAQVYRGKLRSDLLPPSYLGPKRSSSRKLPVIAPIAPDPQPTVPTAHVAVKILHPYVEQIIKRDLRIISFFAHCISIIPGMQWISLPEEVEVFGRMMEEQLDLRNEARNLSIFEENFATRKAAVTFPRPLHDYTSKDILIEEYENALPLKALLKHGGGPFDDVIAESGLDAFLKMLLLDNFVHADLHPGNIMIKFYKPTTSFVLRNIVASIFNTSPPQDSSHAHFQDSEQDAIVNRLRPLISDPSTWREELQKLFIEGYQPELVFIDAGLVTTLDENDRRNFLDLFRAVAEFDGYRAGRLMVERCRSPELAVDPETFALKIQHLVLNVKSRTFSLAKVRISDVLADVLKAVRQHHVKMEADFINTVISVLLLEGIGRQLDPELDLFKSSLPILRQLGRQMTAQENIKNIYGSHLGVMLKIWVWLEARELISSAIVNADDMIKYDWLVPNV